MSISSMCITQKTSDIRIPCSRARIAWSTGMRLPRIILGFGRDDVEPLGAQVGDAVGQPIDMLLDRDDHVAQDARATGPRDEEQVREAGDRQTEVRARAGGPLLAQRQPGAAADLDL